MVHSYNVAEAWLARTAAYCIMAPILEFASAIWAHGPHVEHGTKTAMASMQRQWDMVVRSANGVHRHASVLSLRGDMGLWSLRGRWDYMRLQYHFRLALQPADSWLTKVATLGRQMTAPVQSGAHKDTWHYASERLLVKYGIERGAMGAYRDTPAFLESVGVRYPQWRAPRLSRVTSYRSSRRDSGAHRCKTRHGSRACITGWDTTCPLRPIFRGPTGGDASCVRDCVRGSSVSWARSVDGMGPGAGPLPIVGRVPCAVTRVLSRRSTSCSTAHTGSGTATHCGALCVRPRTLCGVRQCGG
jgi:hypothetical protein